MINTKLYTVSMRVNEEQKDSLEKMAGDACLTVGQYLHKITFSQKKNKGDEGVERTESRPLQSSYLSDEAKEGLEFFGKHYKMIIRLLITLKMEHNMYSDKLLSPEEIDYTMDCAKDFYKTYGIQKPPEDEANEPDNA